MPQEQSRTWARGDVIALRYVTTDARIEMCWPCRVVGDTPELLAVFIAAGSRYKARPKMTAAEKRQERGAILPPHEYEWRRDTLRLFLPGQCHSVFLFWDGDNEKREFLHYFVNMEEPFRRTAVGIDTQDHTLDIIVRPNLTWKWRDEEELDSHVRHGYYTADLARAARLEGERVIEAITRKAHPCLNGWDRWRPDPSWKTPSIPAEWHTTPLTFWEQRLWAYGSGCMSSS